MASPGMRPQASPNGRVTMGKRWKGAVALIFCLVPVGLPHAHLYSHHGWAPVLAIGTVALAALGWWMARGGPAVPVSRAEVLFLMAGGILLTTLFWTRAFLGVPGLILADLPLRLTVAFGGWAWPALLLSALYRRSEEGVRPGGGRRAGLLLFIGFVAGTVGFLVHLPLLDQVEGREPLRQALERPVESSWALTLTGGPRNLSPSRLAVTFNLADPRGRMPLEVGVSGEVLPGIRGDFSNTSRGTELLSSDPEVVRPALDDSGVWTLHPGRPGGAVITVRNRGGRTWIGAWVLEAARSPPAPPVDVTGHFEIEAGPTRPPEEGFAHIQTLSIRNVSREPVLSPLHVVLRTPEGDLTLLGYRYATHPSVQAAFGLDPLEAVDGDPQRDRRLHLIEVVPGTGFPRIPGRVLAPGESASVEIRVTGRLSLDRPGFEARVFRARLGL